MDKRVKKLWVDALESGAYYQCKGALTKRNAKSKDSFCCLGVLTNLYVEETGDAKVWDLSQAFLPDEVCRWAKIEWNPRLGVNTATTVNDKLNYSFKKIAKLIKENL